MRGVSAIPGCWERTIRGRWALVFDHSKHIKVEGVTVQNSGFWQIVPYYSDDLTFRNIKVTAPQSPNTDALDPFSSSNIVIDPYVCQHGG